MNVSSSRAVIYTRISEDPEGLEAGVERQEADCLALAARYGLEVAAIYRDNDVSASTLSKKARPAYREMMQRARGREFGTILAYSNSRLTRRPLELEDIIKLHEATGVTIRTVVSGDDDLSTADGRMIARIKAAVDAGEAERISERQKRANQGRRDAGLALPGRRLFGYTPSKSGQCGVIPAEAELVERVFESVVAGRSLRSLCHELTATGIVIGKTEAWNDRNVRRMVNNPRYAGDAGHPPIVDRELAEQARAILNDPSRTTSPGPEVRHLLSGIAKCGICGARMTAPNSYRCSESGAHVAMVKPRLESVVLGAVYVWILWLRENGGDITTVNPDGSNDTAPIRARLGELREARQRVQLMAEMEGADLAHVARRLRELAGQITTAESELETALQANAGGSLLEWLPDEIATIGDLWDGGAAFLAAFNSWPLERQRDLLRAFKITVNPAPHRGSRDLTRVVVLDHDGNPLPRLIRDTKTGEMVVTRDAPPAAPPIA